MSHTKQNTALLVLDMQDMILNNLPGSEALIQPITDSLAYARQNGIPVIYVAVGFEAGFPEIHPGNKIFGAAPTAFGSISPEAMIKISDKLAPQGNEPVVVKKRISAFTGSSLEVILRSKGITHIVLCGVVTSGVVLSTVIEASDKDYTITVLSDGCADRDEEVHRVLLEKILARHANIITHDAWIAG